MYHGPFVIKSSNKPKLADSRLQSRSIFIKRGDYTGQIGIIKKELDNDNYLALVNGALIKFHRSYFVMYKR